MITATNKYQITNLVTIKQLKFLAILSLLFISFSCKNSDDSDDNETADDISSDTADMYPISLSFKEIAGQTIVHYQGGVLASTDLEDFDAIFDGTSSLEEFNTDTEVNCKSAEITFNSVNELTFTYGNQSLDYDYLFQNDTLKLNLNNQVLPLAVGDKERLTVYGSLYQFKTATGTVGGSDEFLKFNFNGEFFYNSREDRNIPITGPQAMAPEEEVTFFNRSYRLE